MRHGALPGPGTTCTLHHPVPPWVHHATPASPRSRWLGHRVHRALSSGRNKALGSGLSRHCAEGDESASFLPELSLFLERSPRVVKDAQVKNR